jgi:flagellar biosynthetic protein FliR
VTAIGPEAVLATFIMFCRIGACLMLMPGFSSPRVPPRVRLFLAIAITLALAPLLMSHVEAAVGKDSPVAVLGRIASESMTGALLGLMGRIFFLALQFAGGAISMMIGLSNTPDTAIEENEPASSLTSLITLTAVVLLFLTNLHWEILKALVQSYVAMPVTAAPAANLGVTKIVDALSDSFFIALRISAPFIIYSLTINLMFGILGKLTPQIPVYFISVPFVLAGGGFILYFAFGEFVQIFINGFAEWLARV